MCMIAFLIQFLHVVVSPFKTKARLEAEIIMLRHQLTVLRRRFPSKPKLAVADRLLFVWLHRLFPLVLNVVTVSSQRRSSGGIGQVSGCTGVGSRALVAVGQRSRRRFGA
jgi:hypothetical protein